jgi:aryl-alcohol dehydrogenase-like predicted oxidoreductase
MGTMTFGGTGGFASVGATGVDEARRQVDMCLEAGVNLIDTADVYSNGLSEEIVGEVLDGRRDEVLVATKVRMPMGDGPNDWPAVACPGSPASRSTTRCSPATPSTS